MTSNNILDLEQNRRDNVCKAIKKLNAKETRFTFVDYITQNEREIINNIPQEELASNYVVIQLHKRLRDDLSHCFNIDKESTSMTYGRGDHSTHSNGDNLENQNPNLEEILSKAHMHQDSKMWPEKPKNFHISGINAALAIRGPSTIFAEYNQDLYPDWNKFNRSAITNLAQATENQAAIFTKGSSGAAHGWPFKNYEYRCMAFVLSDDQKISDFIIGSTEDYKNIEF